MAACVADADIMFLPRGFYLSIFLSSFPRLISAAADWMSTIPRHNGVAVVRIYTVSHKKRSQLIFVCNFVKNQRILMQFSLL